MKTKKTKLLFIISVCFLTFSNISFSSTRTCLERSISNLTLKNLPINHQLYQMYPDLKPSFIDKKVKAIKTPFMYYRSFVLQFYNTVLHSNKLKTPQKLKQFQGHGLVDYHIDNFNILQEKKGVFRYTMNDPDEGAIVPLYSDFLRYLTSLKLAPEYLTKSEYKQIIKAYKKGLSGEKPVLPDYIKEHLKKLPTTKFTTSEKSISKFRTLKKGRVLEELSVKEKKSFLKVLKQSFGNNAKILDQIKFLNITGGSGGLTRFRFIVKLPKSSPLLKKFNISRTQIFELKEIRVRVNPMSPKNGIKSSTQNTVMALGKKQKTTPLNQVVKVNKTSYLLRPDFKGFKVEAASSLEGEEYFETVLAQAATIGNIHKRALLNQHSDYVKAIESVSETDWINDSKILSKEFRKQFSELKDR